MLNIQLLTSDFRPSEQHLCVGIVEQPTFVPTRITQENTFLHVRLQRVALVLLNEDICKASPNTKMRDIWFALEPSLIGSFALRYLSDSEVARVLC